jgi:hypothetical protein
VEPPSRCTARDVSRADRILALAHVPSTAHVVVIGRHTLPALLAPVAARLRSRALPAPRRACP